MVLRKLFILSFSALLVSGFVSFGANQVVKILNTPDVIDARVNNELIPFLSAQLGLQQSALSQKTLSDVGVVIEANVENHIQMRSTLFNAAQISGLSIRKADFSRKPEGAFKLSISFIF